MDYKQKKEDGPLIAATHPLRCTGVFCCSILFMAKGAIENANGLIRQYIPKTAAFSNFSQQKITKFMNEINERPRKKLNFSTPKECFYKNIL